MRKLLFKLFGKKVIIKQNEVKITYYKIFGKLWLDRFEREI